MFIQVEPVRASVLDVLVCCVDMVLNTEWVQIEAIDLTSDGSAWGFGITGGRSTGVVVKTIVPGSVADKDGRLQIGDHIIQIGDINLRGMGSEQVAMVLRQCGNQVHLIVARPVEPTSPEDSLMQSASAIIPTRVLNEPEELEQQLNVYQPGSNGYSDSMVQDMYCSDPAGLTNHNQKDPSALRKRNEKMDMECFEVNLIKDHQGLGIIVAGYVCEREDISGIFVKSIAKGSVADLCGQIRVHDQVVEVDGHPLKGYSNCEAVEILRNTGKYVKLQLARYHHGSKFEHLQEAMGSDKLQYCNTSKKSVSNQPVDNAYTLTNVEEIKAKWESVLGPKSEVIITELQKYDNEIGFGFNVETRCDAKSVLHHFISDICKGYSVDRSGAVFIGDELLEVNGHKLQDTKYSEVLSIFKSLPPNIVLVCGRSHHWTSNLSLIPWTERLVKSKSDSYLLTRKRCESHEKNFNRRSLELLSSLATWSSEPHFIDLVKGDDGLGFSIMEYKDNLMPSIQDENVIIVWSLVPGAAAQLDGRLLPGDRLLSVNNINFRHTSFDMAQEVLKHVPKGVVRLGVAKPITLSKSVPAKISFKEPIEERSIFSNETTLRVFEYNGVCHTYEEPNNLYTRSQTPSSLFSFGNDSRCSTPFSSPGLSSSGRLWGFEIPVLPAALERIVKIKKGNNKLGLVLDLADRGQNGMIVKSIRPASAVEKDGNVQIGDYILGVNSENMRNITRSQARAIIRRAELTSSDIVIKYIPAADAAVHQQSAVLAKIHEGSVSPTPSIVSRQPSPRVFPAYYRSPYFSHKSTKSTPDHEDADGQISPFSFLSEDDVLATPSSFYTDNFDSSSDDLLLDTPLEGNMKNCEREVFPSVGERILLFQSGKQQMQNTHQVHQVHQVPSKYSRMSTSPTVSPVLGTWSDAHRQPNTQKEVFPSISDKISLFQAQGEQLNVPPMPNRRSSAPNFQGYNRSSSPTSYLYGINRPGSPTYNSYRPGSPNRSYNRYESPTGRKSPEFPGSPKSVPGSPRNFGRGLGAKNSAPPSPLMSPAGNQWGVTRTVELFRQPGQEIGIGVVMGCVDSTDEEATPLSGIFIKHVVPDSIAGRLGTINRGDRIVAVNGIDLANKSYKEAINTIQNSGNPMKLTIQSLVPWVPNNNNNNNKTESPKTDANKNKTGDTNKTTDANKNKIIDSNKNEKENKDNKNTATNKETAQTATGKEPTSPRTEATNMHKEKLKARTMSEDEEEDESQFQGKVFTAKGVEIDRKSAGFLKVADDPEEEDEYGYTQKKIQKKYGDMKGTPILVEVERGAGGIGLSLSGHKNRNRMSSFICGLHPNRNAAKTGKFQVGDEILEVNGNVVANRCHLNVSSIIRSIITPTCKFIVLRHGNTEDMAVKPITSFPVDAENEEMEELISSYPGVRTVVATKEKTGLGIMIVEGSHSEIGRGVFIADLTKDGPADKAGLMAGDMILAINRTKLLGADYETASSVLKNEEGAITFYVLNANAPAQGDKEKAPDAKQPVVKLDHVGQEIATEIKRGDKTGLGITVVGGSDTSVGAIIIQEIFKNGAAAQNGKLEPGDQILEINGKDMRTSTHQDVVNLLRTPGPTITIRIYRHSDPKDNIQLEELNVELTKKPGRGLGLNIVGLANSKGVIISEILKGGVAETEGGLLVGDQILEANGKNLREATPEVAAAVLKTAPGKVTMKIGRIKCEKKPPPKRAMH